jgi:NAD(P)-dependent dehydrogenase (short-subunit alcohol dehydrogenase family)
MDLGLKDKVAIVTGGAKGIGRAACIELAKENVKVIVADIDYNASQRVCQEIETINGQAKPYAVDISSSSSVQGMVDFACSQFSGVDILINSAGIISIADVIDLKEDAWDKVMEINAKGVFLACKAVLGYMIGKGYGKIVNISSQAGKTGFPHESHYSASKGAVIAFTQALAREVAKYNINVNAICPGSIETEMNKIVTEGTAKILGISVAEKRKQTISATPLSRKGTPQDVVNLITFLVSERAGFMTGQAINITGGREFH